MSIKHFIFCLIILNILMPTIFIKNFGSIVAAMNNFQSFGEKDNSIFTQFKIALYISENKEIRQIPFEEYIAQVVYAEMPASFEIEALKAQAIAVRSYTYKKVKSQLHKEYNVCNDIKHCQAWKEADNTEQYKKVMQAVEETKGKVALYEGEVINAVYHASSGGFTEDAVNVWNGHEDYLIAVESPKENEIMYNYEVEVTINKKDFLKKLGLKESKKIDIKILSKTKGNRIKEININKKVFTGNEIREVLNLRSSNFEIIPEGENIKIITLGYGHGVGLSQWGAQAMAIDGKKAEEIIKHYYYGVEVVDV